MAQYISYYRVSTERQGQSGLGLEAQKSAVADFIPDHGILVAEYTEVESGRKTSRPELDKAMSHCRQTGATLVIAKLDRLSRNAGFLLGLRDSGIDFVATDMPYADRFTVGIMALVAEKEAEMISARTKAALRAAKARGQKLGNPNAALASKVACKARIATADVFALETLPTINEIKRAGLTSYHRIASALNVRGIKTAQGGRWYASTVKNIVDRVDAISSRARA